MSITPKISIAQIEKRRRALKESAPVNTDAFNLRRLAIDSLKKDSPTISNDIRRYIQEMANPKDANEKMESLVEFLEMIDNSKHMVMATNLVAGDVIPYVQHPSWFKDVMNRHHINEATEDVLTKALKINNSIDLICEAYDVLSKKFDVAGYIKANRHLSLFEQVSDLCSMIDTVFQEMSTDKRLEVALGGTYYIFEKNNINYDPDTLSTYVAEHYLHYTQEAEQETFDKYKKVLNEYGVFNPKDIPSLKYFLETPEDIVNSDIAYSAVEYLSGDEPVLLKRSADKTKEAINQFKMSPSKTEADFFALIDTICKMPLDSVERSFSELLEWLREYALNQLYSSEVGIAAVKKLIAKCIDDKISSDEAKEIIDILNIEASKYEALGKDSDTNECENIADAYRKLIDSLKSFVDLSSNSDSVKQALGVNVDVNGEVFKLGEFVNSDHYRTLTQMNNVMRLAIKNDKRLNELATPLFITKKDFGDIRRNNESILDCITEDCQFDHVVATIDVNDDSNVDSVRESIFQLCRTNNFDGKTSYAYYETVDSIIEVHIADSNVLDLTESQMDERDNTISESEYAYFGIIEKLSETLEGFENIDTETIAENFAELEPDLNADQICNVLEVAQYMGGLISHDRAMEIAQNYRKRNPNDYIGNSSIDHLMENWKIEDVDLDVMAETVNLLEEAMLNEKKIDFKVDKKENGNGANPGSRRSATGNAAKNADRNGKEGSSDDRKHFLLKRKEEKDADKKEKKHHDKLNLNTLKLAAMDIRRKGKDLDAKAKKMSDEIDMAAEQFMKAVKDLYSNDNRESVIRGSVIPSFHKLFQRGVVGVVGTGVVALFNPTYSVVAAALYIISLIAVSKHSSAKERALLLDEIDIELDVVEKEMSNAEANGKMKKYRQLATYRKKLQREKQRIKYKISYKNMVNFDTDKG